MKKEKIIIFDWGGVVESHDEKEYCIQRATIDFLKSYKINTDGLKDNELLAKYYECCNNLQSEGNYYELFNRIKKTFNIECTIEEFVKRYNQYTFKTKFYKNVVDYAHSLKSRCKIGILSNLTPFDKERIDYQLNLSKFDYVFLSYELNLLKPNPKIYDIVEKDISLPGENILFIDDTKKNLVVPKEMGWNTCQAVGTELDKIKQQVEEFLKD